jgi:NTE family protein
MKHIPSPIKFLSLSAITLLLCACAGTHPNIAVPMQMPKPLHLSHRPQVALVLGAGGARGFAHAGAVFVLQKAGIPINLIVGSSVGSFYGALLADSGNATIAGKIMLSASFWDIADLANVPSLSGEIQGYHYQKFLLSNMRARWFDQLKIPLVVVTTNLKTGEKFVISSGPVAPAAEASAAIPGVVKPAHLYGRTLVDGGITDPVPVDVAMRYHPKVIIAINIAEELSRKMPWTALGVFDRSYRIAWLSFSRKSEHRANIIIRPDVGGISGYDIDQKYRLFRQGEVAAYQALPQIKALLRKKHIALSR